MQNENVALPIVMSQPSTLRALTYPLLLDGNGGLRLSSGVEVVRDELVSVLETWNYERVMNAAYGLPPSLIFSAYTSNSVVVERIRQSIRRSVRHPGLEYSVSGQIEESGAVLVSIHWLHNGLPQPPLEYRFDE